MLTVSLSAPKSIILPDVLAVMRNVAANTPQGDFAEVGVYQGGSAYLLYQLALERGNALELYDTFCGTPFQDPGDTHRAGDFADCNLEALRALMPRAKFHVGLFPDTFEIPMARLAFVHVDCDQYRSVKACINTFAPYMVKDGIMWFDDYHDVPAATRAVNELLTGRIERTVGHKAFVRF